VEMGMYSIFLQMYISLLDWIGWVRKHSTSRCVLHRFAAVTSLFYSVVGKQSCSSS